MKTPSNPNNLPGPIASFFVVLIAGILAMAILFGWSLGWGWIWSRFLPLTLFEASLLTMLATFAVIFSVVRFFGGPHTNSFVDLPDYEDWEEDDEEEYTIPTTRFWKRMENRTREKVFHYVLSNEIYDNASLTPQARGLMNDQQLQELAIRLGEIAIQVLKRKRRNVRTLAINVGQLRQEMQKMGLQPYDDDMLRLTAETVNDLLEEDEEEIGFFADMIRNKRWQES